MNYQELGRRLRTARELRSISQQAAAEALGLPRTAITQMEAGRRAVSTLELVRIAELYGRSVSELLNPESMAVDDDSWVTRHRTVPGLEDAPTVRDQVDRCIRLCHEGTTLKRLLGRDSRSGLPTYSIPVPRSVIEAVRQGEQVADEERRRLDIGDSPVPDMAELLVGQEVWASGIKLLADMSGLFLHHPSVGLAILVNADYPRGRKRFSYAHEYCHALLDRSQPVTVSRTSNAAELVEKRANAFAAAFLMPADGVRELLHNLDKGQPGRQEQSIFDVASGGHIEAEQRVRARLQRLTYKEAAIVAHHFGVSYQAAVYRLKSLRHITQQEVADVLAAEEFGKRYLRALRMLEDVEAREAQARWDRELRAEIVGLAIEAYRQEEISRGRLLELAQLLDIEGTELLDLAEAVRDQVTVHPPCRKRSDDLYLNA